jgi:hypothetical protein
VDAGRKSVKEKVGKGKSSQVRKGKFGKLRRSHQSPKEVRKPRRLMEKSPFVA